MTHDLEEAIALSDEVFLLSAGRAVGCVGRYAVDLPRPRQLIDIKAEAAVPSRVPDDLERSAARGAEEL